MLTGSIADSFLFIIPLILFFSLLLVTFFKVSLVNRTKSIYTDKLNNSSNINGMFYLCFILMINFLFIFLINYLIMFKN